MVRRRIEIKRIEDKAKRHTTFTKRRQGLFKKAKHLCKKQGAQIAVLVFSFASNVYAFGDPSVESVIRRYRAEDATSPEAAANVNGSKEDEDHDDLLDTEKKQQVDYELLLQTLDQLKADLEDMKMNIRSRNKEIMEFIKETS